jgi:hypothetical protein
MRTEKKQRRMLRRHPFLFAFAVAAIVLVAMPSPKHPEPKKLDYSKPTYTGDHAIICPQSLLLDLRADHDANAVFDLFVTILHRDEKAIAFGCEVLRRGILVTAHRMDAPYDLYVSASLVGVSTGSFFTMESELENGIATEESSQSSAVIPMTAAQADIKIKDSYEAYRSDFQKRLSTLEEPMPNLRWFPHAGADDGQVNSLLATPYGPCAWQSGTSIVSMQINPYMPTAPTNILGVFADQAKAAVAAEKYCHDWYVAEASKPQPPERIDHMWFTPDQELQSDATAESMRSDPQGEVTTTTEGSSSQAAVPVAAVPVDAAPVAAALPE